MFWTYFLYTFLAWLVAVLISLETYSSAQVGVNRWQSYKNYIYNYHLYILTSFIFMILLVNLINIGGLDYLLKMFSDITIISDKLDITIINRIFCVIFGLNIEFVLNIFRRWKRPVTIEK